MKDEEYYCKKHKQSYDIYLRGCPVCFGEEMAKDKETWRVQINKKEKD